MRTRDELSDVSFSFFFLFFELYFSKLRVFRNELFDRRSNYSSGRGDGDCADSRGASRRVVLARFLQFHFSQARISRQAAARAPIELFIANSRACVDCATKQTKQINKTRVICRFRCFIRLSKLVHRSDRFGTLIFIPRRCLFPAIFGPRRIDSELPADSSSHAPLFLQSRDGGGIEVADASSADPISVTRRLEITT